MGCGLDIQCLILNYSVIDDANTKDLSNDNVSRVTIKTTSSTNSIDHKQSSGHTHALWENSSKDTPRQGSVPESSNVTNSRRSLQEPLENTIPRVESDRAPFGTALGVCVVPVNITADERHKEEVVEHERQDFKNSIIYRIIRLIVVTYSVLRDSFSLGSRQ